MIQVIAEHSVDMSLLPKQAVILDAGCRGFEFTDYFRYWGHEVLAVDIDDLKGNYLRCAVGHKIGKCAVNYTNDPQGTHIKDGEDIEMVTIESLGEFDLVKLDIEGEEYSILKQSKHPIAKQVSVEFHAHINQTKEQLDSLLNNLEQYYTIHNRVWESRHGAGYNYWDILLIAK